MHEAGKVYICKSCHQEIELTETGWTHAEQDGTTEHKAEPE